MAAKPHRITNYIKRSLLISGTGYVLCLFGGIITVLFGVLGAADQQGTDVLGLSSGFNGLPLVSGLDRLLSHGSWRNAGILIVWTLLLLLIVEGVEFLSGSFTSLQEKRRKESHKSLSTTENRWLLKRAYRRLIIGFTAIICAVILTDLAHWVSSVEKTAVTDVSLTRGTWRMALAVLSWALIYYVTVVFIRLYSSKFENDLR